MPPVMDSTLGGGAGGGSHLSATDEAELTALLKKKMDKVGAVDELNKGVEETKQQIVDLFEAASEEQWRMTQDILRIENEGNLAPLLNLRAMSDLQYARVDLRDVQSQVDEILDHFTSATQGYVNDLDKHVESMKSRMLTYRDSLDSQRGSLDGMKRRYEACLERMRKNDIQMDFLRGQVVRREALLHDQKAAYLKELNMYKELLFAKRQKGEDFNVEQPMVDVLGGGGEIEPLMTQLEKALAARKQETEAKAAGGSGGGGGAASNRKADAQWQSTFESMKRHHANEVRQMQEEFEKILAEKDQVIALKEEEAKAREEQFKSEIEEYTSMQSEGAEEARRQLEEDMDALKNDFQVEKTALIASHDEAMAAMQLKHEELLSGLRNEFESDTASLKTQVEQLSQELKHKVSMIDTLDQDIAKLQHERDEALDAAQDETANRAAQDAELQRQIRFLQSQLEEAKGGKGGKVGASAGSAAGGAVSQHRYEDIIGHYVRLQIRCKAAEDDLEKIRTSGIDAALAGVAPQLAGQQISSSMPNPSASLSVEEPHGSGGGKRKGKRPVSAKPKRPSSRASSRAGSAHGKDKDNKSTTSASGARDKGGALSPHPTSRPPSVLSARSGAGSPSESIARAQTPSAIVGGGDVDDSASVGSRGIGATAGDGSGAPYAASSSSSSSSGSRASSPMVSGVGPARPSSRASNRGGDTESINDSGRNSVTSASVGASSLAPRRPGMMSVDNVNHSSNNSSSTSSSSGGGGEGRVGHAAGTGYHVEQDDAEAQTPSSWLRELAEAYAVEHGLLSAEDVDRGDGASVRGRGATGMSSKGSDVGGLSDQEEDMLPLTTRGNVQAGGRRSRTGADDEDGADVTGGGLGSGASRGVVDDAMSHHATGRSPSSPESLRRGIDTLTAAVQETDTLRSRRAIVNWELLFKGAVTAAIQREREAAMASGAADYGSVETDREMESRIANLQVFDRMEARASYRLKRARNRLLAIEEERRLNMEKVMAAARLLVDPAEARRREMLGSRMGMDGGGGGGGGGHRGYHDGYYDEYDENMDEDGFTTIRMQGGMGGSTAPLSFRQRPHSAAAVISRGAGLSAASRGGGAGGARQRAPVVHQAKLSAGGVSFAKRHAGPSGSGSGGDFPVPEPFDPSATGGNDSLDLTPMPPVFPRPRTAPDNQYGGNQRHKGARPSVPRLGLDGSGNDSRLSQSLRFDGRSGTVAGNDGDLMRIQSMTHRDGSYSPPRSATQRVKTPLTERLRRSQSPQRQDRSTYLPRADVKVNFTNLSQAERRDMILKMIYRDSKLAQLRKRGKSGEGSGMDSARGVGGHRGSMPSDTSHPFGGKATPVMIKRLGKGSISTTTTTSSSTKSKRRKAAKHAKY